LLLLRYRAVVHASETLRRLSHRIPLLTKVADSLYVTANRAD